MKIAELEISTEFKELLLNDGITELYPPQAECISKGLLDGKNMVVAIPTASGKTLIALLAILSRLHKGSKAIYLAPLRALAAEKYREFQAFAQPLGLSVALATGEFDSKQSWLKSRDIIIATNEKFDSVIRHQVEWLNDIEVIVSDEVHLINDISRGPVLEVVLSQIAYKLPECQIIALSATINNADEIAEWLNAVLIKSDWRPVNLKEGVWAKNVVYYADGSRQPTNVTVKDSFVDLAIDSLSSGGQSLVFCNTRKSVVTSARKIASKYSSLITPQQQQTLKALVKQILQTGEQTTLSRDLAAIIANGVGFHHAGLHYLHRKIVEDAYRARQIKILTASPTLAAGINLPARRVIIRSLQRYYAGRGSDYIPILEYKQMAGRAGRPRYDEYGESIVIAKNYGEKDRLLDHYLRSDSEDITSKFGTEPSLRMHLLSFIVSEDITDFNSAMDVVATTFYGYQNDGQMYFVEESIFSTLELLQEAKMVTVTEPYTATKFGKKICELYLDPLSAQILRKALLDSKDRVDLPAISYLQLICATPDVRNYYVRDNEMDVLITAADLYINDWITPDAKDSEVSWEFFLQQLKTALVMDAWLQEQTEEAIYKRFNVSSGDLQNLINAAEWLLHSALQIAKLFKWKNHIPQLEELNARIQYGISAELVELTKIKGIGRRRARKLFDAGITTIVAVLRTPFTTLSKLIGETLAKNIRQSAAETSDNSVQFEDTTEFFEVESAESAQTSLDDFF